MKFTTLLLAAAAVVTPITFVATAVDSDAKPVFVGVEGENIAVGGYDTVSYFRGDGVPVPGTAAFATDHDGAVYRFSSEANRDAFMEDPDAFLPQYGGHCAWAMSRGSLAPGDPTLYRVEDGKLYLNFNRDVQKTWLADIDGFIAKADGEWSKVPDDAAFGG